MDEVPVVPEKLPPRSVVPAEVWRCSKGTTVSEASVTVRL